MIFNTFEPADLNITSPRVFNNVNSAIAQTTSAFRVGVVDLLPSQERNGALAYSNGSLQFFNGVTSAWSPIAVGSGGLVTVLNGLETVGTAVGAQPFFQGYDIIALNKFAKIATLAPGPSGNVVIVSSPTGSVIIDAGTAYTLTDGGTALNHRSLVSSTSGGQNLKPVGLNPGTAISLSTTGVDVTITNTSTFTDGGVTLGHQSLVAAASVSPTFEILGLDAGFGIGLATTGVDVTISLTNTSFTDGGTIPGHTSLVSATSTPTTPQTVGLDAGPGIALSTTGTDVTISSATTLADGGVTPGNISLVDSGVAPLSTTGIVATAGNNVVVTTSGTDVTLAVSADHCFDFFEIITPLAGSNYVNPVLVTATYLQPVTNITTPTTPGPIVWFAITGMTTETLVNFDMAATNTYLLQFAFEVPAIYAPAILVFIWSPRQQQNADLDMQPIKFSAWPSNITTHTINTGVDPRGLTNTTSYVLSLTTASAVNYTFSPFIVWATDFRLSVQIV